MKKINFAGGEPFILDQGKYLGELIKYSKDDLSLESVSVISNGSRVTQEWMNTYGRYLDIMGVSCDSFDDETNVKIGRFNANEIKNLNHKEKML